MKELCRIMMLVLLLFLSLVYRAQAAEIESCLGFSWDPGVSVTFEGQDGPEGGCGYNQVYSSWDLNPYGGTLNVSAKWSNRQGMGWGAPWISLALSTGEQWSETKDPNDTTPTTIVLGPKTIHYDFSAGCFDYVFTFWPFPSSSILSDFISASVTVRNADPTVCGGGQHKLSPDPDQLGTPCENPDTKFDGGGPGCKAPQGLPIYWVNTSFLTLVLEDTDFAYRSYDHDVALQRVWNMNATSSGMFGRGWSFAYEASLKVKGFNVGDDVAVVPGSGQITRYSVSEVQEGSPQTVKYTRASPGLGPALTGYVDTATGNGYYILIDKKDKLSYRYEFSRKDATTGEYLYRLASITDPNGNALTLAYNGELLASLTDASGRVTSFTYNAQNLCSEINTFHGKKATYAYDAQGRLIQSADLAGNISAYTYDERNNVLTMTAAGKTTTFAYAQATPPVGSAVWHVSKVTDPSGNETLYNYTDTWKTRVTEPGGGKRTYAHLRGRTAMAIDPLGKATIKTYDLTTLLPVSVVDARGNKTTYAYDANGNLISLTEPGGQTTSFAYDDNWNLVSMTDPASQVWQFTYDANSNLAGVKSPLNRNVALAVNGRGLVTGMTLPDNSVYNFTYDSHSNMTGVTNPLGHSSLFQYDETGLELSSFTDPLGNKTGFQYDANRRLTSIARPDGTTLQYERNCCALESFTDGGGRTTTFQHDPLLRLTGITDPLGNSYNYSYDKDGALIQTSNPLGQITTGNYDAAHRLINATNPAGGTIAVQRNADGSVASLTNERGNTTMIYYDARGLLTNETDPLGFSNSLGRDSLGRISTFSGRRGIVTTYAYDADGNLITKTMSYPLNGPPWWENTVETYAWNDLGLLQSVTDPSGTKTFTRDAAGQITGIAYPDGKALNMTYDKAGNIKTVVYPGDLTITYGYDVLNRVNQISFGAHSITYQYDASGNLIAENRSNGVQSFYQYNAARHLTGVAHKKGETAIVDLTYARNAAGLITGESGISPLAPVFEQNAEGSYNNADALENWAGDAYTYDDDGNLTGITGSRNFSATYDNNNFPLTITRDGVTSTYKYDGLGNRASVQTGAETRLFHHDPEGRLMFDNKDGQLAMNLYIYAGNRLVAFRAPSGDFYFFHHDKTGSTLALTDTAGNVAGAFAYGPYGQVVGRSGSMDTPFTYVGGYGVMDEGNGLFFMKNRYYDAETGRFLQRDPIGFAGGFNLYRYAGGNPVMFIDPEGTNPLLFLAGAYLTYKGLKYAYDNTAESVGEAIDAGRNALRLKPSINGLKAHIPVDPKNPKIEHDWSDAKQEQAGACIKTGERILNAGVVIGKGVLTTSVIVGNTVPKLAESFVIDRLQSHAMDVVAPTSDNKRWWEFWK